MYSPQFAPLPAMPSLGRPAESWTIEETCSVGTQLYRGMYASIAAAMLRQLGHERMYEVYGKSVSDHQKHYFVPGLKKLGLHKEKSHATACAKYHCISTGLGGWRSGYAVEDENKAWLFYFPPTADSPGNGLFLLSVFPEFVLSDYRGWHGNNGRYLGNNGLRFVATHFISEGDPYIAGYFEDTGRELADDELVIERRGEAPPRELKIRAWDDELDAQEWPAERKARALRKYALGWFADRVRSTLYYCGEEGEEIVRRGIQFTLHTWMPRFSAAVASEGLEPPAEMAKFIEFFHSVVGISTQLTPASDGWYLTTKRGLVEFVGDDQPEHEKVRFAKALGDSWHSVARLMDCIVSVDGLGTHWTIRSAR